MEGFALETPKSAVGITDARPGEREAGVASRRERLLRLRSGARAPSLPARRSADACSARKSPRRSRRFARPASRVVITVASSPIRAATRASPACPSSSSALRSSTGSISIATNGTRRADTAARREPRKERRYGIQTRGNRLLPNRFLASSESGEQREREPVVRVGILRIEENRVAKRAFGVVPAAAKDVQPPIAACAEDRVSSRLRARSALVTARSIASPTGTYPRPPITTQQSESPNHASTARASRSAARVK